MLKDKHIVEKIVSGAPESRSADTVADNIRRMKEIFPDAFTEGKIDFAVLRQLLGDSVDEGEEKYGLNWHGKRRARQLALTPSTGTLRPCPEDSVDWDTTQNLMIEGDNLEVLKLLQKSYAGKVKLIYIDPPYNTGKDFVYADDWRDGIQNYLQITGQLDENSHKLSSNSELSGRFHTHWLQMMYPRLRVARSLLSQDGILCVSIGETELSNLVHACGELFGEENLVGIVTWKARAKPVNVGFSQFRPQRESEYVLIYQKTEHPEAFSALYSGSTRSYPYHLDGRKYRLATILKSNRGTNFRRTMNFEHMGYSPPEGQRWQAGKAEIERLHESGHVEYRDGTPFRRYFEDEEKAEHDPFYCFMDGERSSTSEKGKTELNELLGNDHGFDTVKPTRLLRTLIAATTSSSRQEIVVDFFAGSGTTFDSVLQQNLSDQGDRRMVLVQIPEILDPESKDQSTAAGYCDKIGKPQTVVEITKERCRQAGLHIKNENAGYKGDLGFRVFKLDSSNIRSWDTTPDDLEDSILASLDHIKQGRTEQDILYELLLKLGLDLCIPIESRTIANKSIHSVGAGTLIACLDAAISRGDAEPLATGIADWHDELAPVGEATIVFRDSAFADDVTKTNLAEILKQRGLGNVKSM